MPVVAIAVTGTLFTSCVDSEKDLYDPSFQTSNPMGDGFAAPNGFDWNMMSNVKVNVEVNAQSNDEYYVVEIYDANPIISPNASLLAKGVAKGNKPYTSEISITSTTNTIFVKEITPTGLVTVKAADITNGTANCSFKTSAPTSRSLAATRANVNVETPDPNDTSLFPTECPQGIETFVNESSSKANSSYKVTSSTTEISLGGKANIKLYVTEDITLTKQMYLTSGSALYILPGKTVRMAKSENNGQLNSMITIGKNASLIVENGLKLDSNFKVFNLGTLKAKSIVYTNQSYLYNGNDGVVTVEKEISGENANCIAVNDGTITANNITLHGNSSFINREKVEVKNETVVNCTAGSWENNGEWITDNMALSAWNAKGFNGCKLIVKNKFTIGDATLTNDAGAYVQCKELYMNNATVLLGAKAMFEVTGEAVYGYQTKERGFKGTGAEKALLVVKKAVAENKNKTNIIHYSGNLQIICSDHPEAEINPWNIRWTLSGGAEWAEEGKNTVSIPASECSNGYNSGNPGEVDPEFPIEFVDTREYTYMFEDQWPLYGDYDMNDLVIVVKERKIYTNEDNKVVEFKLNLDLAAAGATKSLGAAIMLDAVSANAITQPIELGDNSLASGFNLNNNNIENGQDYAVIPLFNDAHKVLGRNQNIQINTIIGSGNNTNPRNISFTIRFNNPTLSAEAFNIDKLNVFIIVDGNRSNRKEIHVTGYQPTRLANTTLFGGNNDGSSLSSKKYYISKENLAWGIMVPTDFKWPTEYSNIKNVYSEFADWVTSGGTKNEEWWKTFDSSKVYK